MIKKILNVFTTIILVVLVFIVIMVFISRISGKVPSVFGYQVYRVSSGSMEPMLKIGDVILVKSIEPSEIKKGDIITYNGTQGEYRDKIITHMVIRDPFRDSNGNFSFQTRGIANGAIDDPIISQSQVLGKYQYKIPLLNYLYSFFLSDYGLIAFVGLIVILFAYEIISIILSYKSTENEMFEEEYQQNKYKDDNDDDMYKPL